MAESDETMTVTEARVLLGISRAKMADLLATGVLSYEPDVLDKRLKLVKRADVEALRARAKRKRPTTAV